MSKTCNLHVCAHILNMWEKTNKEILIFFPPPYLFLAVTLSVCVTNPLLHSVCPPLLTLLPSGVVIDVIWAFAAEAEQK